MFTMLVLGGDYKVWVTTSIFDSDNYYEVMLSKKMPEWPTGYYCYVNPIKEIFKWEMTDRNPLSRPKDKERPTPEEIDFRTEQYSYNNRKEMGMPLTKLSRKHVQELLQKLSQ